ncbi:unnamed protein product [Leuciscus chuanchicus]
MEHAENLLPLYAVEMDAALEIQSPEIWDSFPLFQPIYDFLHTDYHLCDGKCQKHLQDVWISGCVDVALMVSSIAQSVQRGSKPELWKLVKHSSPARRWRESPALLRRTGHNPATYSSDPACWDKIDEDMRACWIKMGPESRQNKDADVAASETQHKHQKRNFFKTLCNRKLANGETQPRERLLYSVFCSACELCVDRDMRSALTSGYSERRHAAVCLAEHEERHREAGVCYSLCWQWVEIDCGLLP